MMGKTVSGTISHATASRTPCSIAIRIGSSDASHASMAGKSQIAAEVMAKTRLAAKVSARQNAKNRVTKVMGVLLGGYQPPFSSQRST
jgi:hypothetical protein